MRVLHLDSENGWRGGENQMRLLIEGLAAQGHENHVLVRQGSEAAKRLRGKATIHEAPYRGSLDVRTVRMIKRIVVDHKIDLMDAHTSQAHGLAWLAKSFGLRCPLVVHRRVDYLPGRDLVNRRKYKTKHVNQYVAISKAIGDILIDYGIAANKVAVVPSAIEESTFSRIDRPAAKKKLADTIGISADQIFIGVGAAMTNQKGLDVFIRSLAELKNSGRKFHAFHAGSGPLARQLEDLRAQCKLEHDLTMLGQVQAMPEFLAALDVLFVPSNYEGLGTIIMEGTYAGCAVVASRVGGIPEMIRDGHSGLLADPGDVSGFATQLQTIVDQPAKMAIFHAAAITHIREHFSLDAMVNGNLKVYEKVIPQN